MIYEYALMAKTVELRLSLRGTKFILTPIKDRRPAQKVYSFNQLQYVSKQVRMWTHGLEAKFNLLSSNFRLFHMLQQQAARYTQAAQSEYHWIQHLHQIKLTGFTIYEPPAANVLHDIIRFANTHAHVNIHVGVQSLCIHRGAKTFLTRACLIEEAHHWTARPSFIAPDKGFTKLWRQEKTNDFLNNPRVRFFPAGPFNEPLARRYEYKVGGAYRRDLIAFYGGDQDAVFARIKAIYMNGV